MFKIDSYRHGKMVMSGKTHTKDFIIFGDKIIKNLWMVVMH